MKKRILSFLMALLMVVSIIPFSIFAEGEPEPTPPEVEGTSEPTTEPVTDPPCDTCGAYDCGSEHLNWCADCRMDDCGQNHCPTCGTIDCTADHGAPANETPTEAPTEAPTEPEKHSMVGKVVKTTTFGFGNAYADISNMSDYKIVASTYYPKLLVVDAVALVGSTTYYQLSAGPDCSWPQVAIDAELTDGFWLEAAKLVEATWCAECEEYDCGVDHSQPENPCGCCENCTGAAGCECKCGNCDFCEKEPENTCECDCESCTGAEDCECFCGECDFCEKEPVNTCECGCESCTGAEGCECLCGNCDFCEKEEEPTEPELVDGPIYGSVNGQTITVNGKLPEGAKLVVKAVENEDQIMEALGLDGDFLWDIKIYDANGNEWQPETNDSVQLSLPFSGTENGDYAEIVHFLSTEDQIESALHNTDATAILNVESYGNELKQQLQKEITAYQSATGDLSDSVVITSYSDIEIIEGKAIIEITGFSVFTGKSHRNETTTGSTKDLRIVLPDMGGTYYVTKGSLVYVDSQYTGAKSSWSINGGASALDFYNVLLDTTPRAKARFTVTGDEGADINVKYPYSFNVQRWAAFKVVKEYKLTYNAKGGTVTAYTGSGNNTSTAEIVTQDVITYEAVSLPIPKKTGYTFTGWSCSNGSTYCVNGAAQTYTVPTGSADLTFTAQWTVNNYTVKFDPNTANAGNGTVTGSMPTLNMTYDVETTLPRNQFINQGDGMVFLGWATSPTGDVVHKDGAKVKNLTTTNGATVTLYAKWKYGLASTVYIGINNTYHNPKGTYTAGGVTIDSYHTYPNEPAQMTGDFDRVTDTSGGWTYNSESAVPLKNQAASYINGNIFNSPDYKMTYVEGENTLGIAAPTGGAVRAMLKFTEADYNAMIAAWLEGMRSTLIGYGDTSVDWQNAKAEDFTMVPYVIKFQNYDSWYIDMVVKPKALYTLAYDGNIENGYTATFTGVAFPPSAQYTEGSSVNIVTTPIGYNSNNLKVTKVVDGHTYTAVFQYWYDADGNTYGGTTGRNTITLTEDTILYAKWEYPDASYGNLNITKNVVDKDAYDNPSATQNFTFRFATSASGSYNYTVYDRTANVKASGTIANNGTFTLQDGWRIRITDLPKDATYSVTETAVNYYTASGTVSGTISAGATTYATVTNTFQKNAAYTVKHHLKNDEDDGYTEQRADRETLYGIIGQNTAAVAKTTYSGYAAKPFEQAAIQKDGSTVINIYYDVNTHTVTASGDSNVTVTGTTSQTVTHGQENEPITFKPKDGYRISKVTINGEEQTGFDEKEYTFRQTIDENVTIYVTTEKAVADLTISISGNISGQNYVFSVTNSKGAEVNRVVLYTDKTSITIRELPVDTYTVTPVSGWDWRGGLSESKSATLPSVTLVEFVRGGNTKYQWLNGFNNDGKKGG